MKQNLREEPTAYWPHLYIDLHYEKEPTLDTINDIMMYLQAGAQHNYNQRGFTHQLVEMDLEIHSLTLGQSLGNPVEEGEEE